MVMDTSGFWISARSRGRDDKHAQGHVDREEKYVCF